MSLDQPSEAVITLARAVGQVTRASLHVTCKPLNLLDVFIQSGDFDPQKGMSSIRFCGAKTAKIFLQGPREKDFTIYHPVQPVVHAPHGRSKNPKDWHRPTLAVRTYKSEAEQVFVKKYRDIANLLLILMNTDSGAEWQAFSFHPWWTDTQWLKKTQKQAKARSKAHKQRERVSSKKAEALSKEGTPHPETGAGRGSGAIPGIFMGVQMRSQLEIRLAAELQDREICWVYERERLGSGNYLVDFHLPDLHCWIEVKGKMEARDKYLLREVSELLHGKRGERLFLFTSRRVYEITSEGQGAAMKHREFWTLLEALQ